jgi:hypothetical protein
MGRSKQAFEDAREDMGLTYEPSSQFEPNYDSMKHPIEEDVIPQPPSIYKALADFQQEVPVIFQGSQGYGYKYADLPTILRVINPLLKKHGLGFTQPLNGKSITTIVFHIPSGQTIEGTIEIPQGVQLKGMNDFQVLGSAISYLRRYSISSILGLISDADNDAAGKQVPTPQPKAKPETTGKKRIAEKDFIRLVGAVNAGNVATDDGEVITKEWAMQNYALTTEQIATLEML